MLLSLRVRPLHPPFIRSLSAVSSLPLRVAVVGSGPSGFYTCKYLLQNNGQESLRELVLIDRLPTPFGLVRYGVAPDHPEVRGAIVMLENPSSRMKHFFRCCRSRVNVPGKECGGRFCSCGGKSRRPLSFPWKPGGWGQRLQQRECTRKRAGQPH
jgi:hypothetical protein